MGCGAVALQQQWQQQQQQQHLCRVTAPTLAATASNRTIYPALQQHQYTAHMMNAEAAVAATVDGCIRGGADLGRPANARAGGGGGCTARARDTARETWLTCFTCGFYWTHTHATHAMLLCGQYLGSGARGELLWCCCRSLQALGLGLGLGTGFRV